MSKRSHVKITCSDVFTEWGQNVHVTFFAGRNCVGEHPLRVTANKRGSPLCTWTSDRLSVPACPELSFKCYITGPGEGRKTWEAFPGDRTCTTASISELEVDVKWGDKEAVSVKNLGPNGRPHRGLQRFFTFLVTVVENAFFPLWAVSQLSTDSVWGTPWLKEKYQRGDGVFVLKEGWFGHTYCHWAILVGGWVFEIRSEGKRYWAIKKTKWEWDHEKDRPRENKYAHVKYLGDSVKSVDEVENFANEFAYRPYRLLTDNCQHFVQYLAEFCVPSWRSAGSN